MLFIKTLTRIWEFWFSLILSCRCYSEIYFNKPISFSGLASSIDKVAKKNKIEGATNADAAVQKYLQAALVLDEHVAAAHGNDTTDYMLVLANIVSNGLANEQDLQGMIGRREAKKRRGGDFRFPRLTHGSCCC